MEASGSARVEDLLAQLTLEEKVAMAAGRDVWHGGGVPRLGIRGLKMTDGPNGARGARMTGTTSACFPCGTALAATWNTDLVRRVGEAIAEEARTKGAHVLLGPTVNIHRSPLAGRNFECYSEDPFLSARMAAAYIEGAQSRGVATAVKHFVCNDSEFERMTISSEVAERPLREIYLPPFHAAVTEAGTWALMAAYNRVNGTYAAEHAELLGALLRGEWGFDGFVVSDWWGAKSTVQSANAGLDIEMPGPPVFFGESLLAAVRAGDVDEQVLEAKARRLLVAAERTGALDEPDEGPERSVDDPAHRALAREAAAQGFVLLKNEGGALPLDAGRLHSLAVIGPNADTPEVQGGGSARVNPHYTASLLEALRSRLAGVEVGFERGCTIHRDTPALDSRLLEPVEGGGRALRVEYFDNLDMAGSPVHVEAAARAQFSWLGQLAGPVRQGDFSVRGTGLLVAPDTGTYRFALTSAGLSRLLLDGEVVVDNWSQQTRGKSFFGAGSSEVSGQVEMAAGEKREIQLEFRARERSMISGVSVGCLPPEPADLLERAEALAARCDAALVVVGLSPEWESEGFDRATWELPGRQAELVERVAASNAHTVVLLNAGSPVEMSWARRVPAVAQVWYGGQEAGNGWCDALMGDADPSGRLPSTLPARMEDTPSYLNYPGEKGEVRYGEGVFVGYRWYDARRIEPRYCFGHGLSYTTFDYGPVSLEPPVSAEPRTVVRVDVTNAGNRAGREVVQVYVRDLEAGVARPDRELKAFAKIDLGPGQSRRVELGLGPGAFSWWDVGRHAWVAEPGNFEILVGRSSRDIRSSARFSLRP